MVALLRSAVVMASSNSFSPAMIGRPHQCAVIGVPYVQAVLCGKPLASYEKWIGAHLVIVSGEQKSTVARA
jgi:hypothetical protein